jgi:hypothetical protein
VFPSYSFYLSPAKCLPVLMPYILTLSVPSSHFGILILLCFPISIFQSIYSWGCMHTHNNLEMIAWALMCCVCQGQFTVSLQKQRHHWGARGPVWGPPIACCIPFPANQRVPARVCFHHQMDGPSGLCRATPALDCIRDQEVKFHLFMGGEMMLNKALSQALRLQRL